MNVAAKQFLDAIRAAGLLPPDTIRSGHFYRFPGLNKASGSRVGWCSLFDDQRGAGVFGDYSTGLSETWQAKRSQPYTADEHEAHWRKVEEGKARAEAERKAEYDKAAHIGTTCFRASEPACADHPYLVRKAISPVETLRELTASELARLIGYPIKSNGETLAGRVLIAPVRIGDSLSRLEFIDEAGHKSALAGGAKVGGFWSAQKLPGGDGSGPVTAVSAPKRRHRVSG